MNNPSPSPLFPHGSVLEQKNRSRARVRLLVFFVLSIHVVGLMALLMQGCRRQETTEAVQPVDTTGAGDAFIGSLACFLAEGLPEMEAIARANLYAALSTLGAGTQKSFVTRERFNAEWAARA